MSQHPSFLKRAQRVRYLRAALSVKKTLDNLGIWVGCQPPCWLVSQEELETAAGKRLRLLEISSFKVPSVSIVPYR